MSEATWGLMPNAKARSMLGALLPRKGAQTFSSMAAYYSLMLNLADLVLSGEFNIGDDAGVRASVTPVISFDYSS